MPAGRRVSVHSPSCALSALQVARKAEILSPLGALYYNTGRYEEALQVYGEAAALQPAQRELRLALVSSMAVEACRIGSAPGGSPGAGASTVCIDACGQRHFIYMYKLHLKCSFLGNDFKLGEKLPDDG